MIVEIRPASWADDHAPLAAIRRQVFIDEQGVPAELEWDAADAAALHWLAVSAGQALGTVRLLADGHIGRMAVLASARRQGIGSALLLAAIARAAADGLAAVYLHAQLQALPFYLTHGFKAEEPVFMDAGIPHRTLRRALIT